MATESNKYHFESFEANFSEFDGRFTEYLNSKYDSGWKHKSCEFQPGSHSVHAFCLFKKRK